MYTLSKDSWHYRLVSFFGRVPDTINLCPYIRDVLACILISAVGVAIGVWDTIVAGEVAIST